MTNKQSPLSKNAGTALIALGVLFAALGSQEAMVSKQASLSGQGALYGNYETGEAMLMPATALHSAAPIVESSMSGGMVAFGALMMLLGFGIHAFLASNGLLPEKSHAVPVRQAKKRRMKPRKKREALSKTLPPRLSRKPFEVIWIERTIRF